MTDLEKFIELYKSFGIEVKAEECTEVYMHSVPDPDTLKGKYFVITLQQGENEKFLGYYDMFSKVVFDENGKFIHQSFWE